MATEIKTADTTIRAIVAPGHTVWVGAPPDHKAGRADERKECMPGQEVHLERADYKRLLSLGYLVNPDGSIPAPMGSGPEFFRDTTPGNNPAGIGPR